MNSSPIATDSVAETEQVNMIDDRSLAEPIDGTGCVPFDEWEAMLDRLTCEPNASAVG